MKSSRASAHRVRTWIGAAVLASLSGAVWAQGTLKVGLLSILEGPFASGGQDGIRGAELALKQKGGMAGGMKIQIVSASSDGNPDKADPGKALDLLAKLAEFAAPKLGRVEHTGEGGGPVRFARVERVIVGAPD